MFYIYGKKGCGYCTKAKRLAEQCCLDHAYIDLADEPELIDAFRKKGYRPIPQIFYNGDYSTGHYVGGFDQFKLYVESRGMYGKDE